ncbi:uncharacterized protein BP01DRAFT_398403 [Aspergillus saccharolyticus JOP 1030-1]|uniref:Gfd2/YDR514C-like C-terminal domain-containing protein n=1 Tax=Aspergillus saccharolyticus JOP 1030-1 TaxID=1450539 RepID=A0A318ZFJ6_9EURO|nr:hypothetical protein BP01DRAFT_398403 [Aspergillus saccharolyticus JOP 1030-1]PYH45477.1 hypothetical protein BP01DRAFT_398403 [Aspergillus saccharolyticus JOP 1030-1]
MTPEERLEYLFAGVNELLKMDTRLNQERALKEASGKDTRSEQPCAAKAKHEQVHPEEAQPEELQPERIMHIDIQTEIVKHKEDKFEEGNSKGLKPEETDLEKITAVESNLDGPELEDLVLGDLKHVSIDPAKSRREEPNIEQSESEELIASIEDSHKDTSDKIFAPIIALSRYPYKFIKDEGLSQQIASRFFDKNQFWARSWDIYYHYTPSSLGCRPILLTPARHARRFLGEINRALSCTLQLPAEADMGMILSFDHDAYPQPIFLGTSTNREAKDRLQGRVPPPTEHYLDPWKGMGDEHRELAAAYEAMLEAACDVSKNKKKPNAAQKLQQRIEIEHRQKETLLRAQQYLGMRPAGPIDESLKYLPLNPDAVAPFAFWKGPVFVSVDVEWNERCHTQITEVGLSVLDTRKLHDMRPSSTDGVLWRRAIQSQHWRVREYSHIVNNDFVSGCPGNFLFGDSKFVGLEQLKGVVQEAFQHAAVAEKKQDESKDRHVVLVGHNLAADLEHLRRIGVSLEMMKDCLDTASLDCFMRADPQQQPVQPRSLGAVVTDLGLEPWHLHNAGNDARYSLEALVAIILGYKADH